MNLRTRLERLEAGMSDSEARADTSAEALEALSSEELDALEDTVEAAVAGGERSFWDLFAVVSEQGRRAREALFAALAPVHRGEELPTPDERPASLAPLLERMGASEGNEEARREWGRRDGCRIWKYYRKTKRS